ncbi:MAG: SDR family oxidoreductase [Candidatus Kaiserbacteria bacterium]|nr:SDR family oxidoreductase [Candidatus Kaiserbacteria bacterium]
MSEKLQIVAVSGAHGLLGSTLLRTQITGFSTTGLSADIRDSRAVFSEIEACKPQWIIHTAAKTDVGNCERNPEQAHAVNVEGTKNVIEAVRAANARLIYISTVSVFPGHEGNYKEEDVPEPVNTYNKTKREGELAALSYEKGVVLRLNLVGVHPDGSRGKNFLEWLIDSIRLNKDISLFNDQFVNPLSNWTVASIIKMMIEKDSSEKILHIGSSDTLSKAAIGKLVLARFPEYRGIVVEKSIESIADGVTRPRHMWLNVERASALFGPFSTVEQELDTLFQKSPFKEE